MGTPGFLALTEAGCGFVDSAPVTQAAREVKTPEEIRLFRANAPIVMEQLRAVEATIAPGVQEREIFAAMADGLPRDGVEYYATNTVCSGPNTNPWRAEATDRAIEPGDLVFVDTDTVGVGGAVLLRLPDVRVGGRPRPRSATPTAHPSIGSNG